MSGTNLADVLKRVYEQKSSTDMDIIEAIRIIFASRGYDILFDYPKLRSILWDLSPAEDIFRKRFALIYESGAIDSIKAATLDAYHYKENFDEAERKLCKSGLTEQASHETVFIFYDALGFPVDRKPKDPQKLGDDKGWTYFGEVKNGKQHGRGHEELIYDGHVYDVREGLWIDGQVYGYLYSEEEYGFKEYCFCVDGMAIGKDTHISGDGQIFVDEYKYKP